MIKTKIIDQNSERNILQERLFLSKMNNPFLVNMLCSFQDKDYLYLVLQLFTGGDLRYHLTNYIYPFTETQLKFLFSNIILALQYIHSKGVLHRDLKPENILFDNEGYAYVTDFGIACSMDEDNEGDNSGTPAYMAPESLYGLKQDYCVDFYSLGIIGYEIMMGKTPYEGNSRHEIKKQMLQRTEYITEADNYSEICIDFINGLINKSPSKRIGAGSGISELKDNIFFKGLNWELIYQHKYLSPLYDIIKFSMIRAGEVEELFDVDYCAKKESIDDSTFERYEKIRNGKYYSKYFKKYSIICVDNILSILPKTQKVQIINRVPLNQQYNMNYNNINNNGQLNNAQRRFLNRSQSIGNMAYPNVYDMIYRKHSLKNEYNKNYDYDVRHRHRKYKYVSRSQIKNDNEKVHLKLPFIKNNNIKNEREKKIKYYYENKLLKYKSVLKKLQSYYLDKLKEKEKEKKEIRNKEKYKMHLYNNNIERQPIINPNFPCQCQYNNCGLNYCGNCIANHNNNNNNNQLSQINFKTYFDQIYKNRDNFFFKYNDEEDYNGDYSYEYSDNQMSQLEPHKYYDSPNMYGPNFHHPNQFFHRNLYEQNLKERNRIKDKEVYRNKLRYITEKSTLPPKYVEYEETVTDDDDDEDEEEEEEEEESIQEIRRPVKYIKVFKTRPYKTKTKTKSIKKSSKKNKRKEKESKKEKEEESNSKDETSTVKVKKSKKKSSKKTTKTNKKSKKITKSNKKEDNKKKKEKNKGKAKEDNEEEEEEEKENEDKEDDEDEDGEEKEEGEGEEGEEGEGEDGNDEEGEGEDDEEGENDEEGEEKED